MSFIDGRTTPSDYLKSSIIIYGSKLLNSTTLVDLLVYQQTTANQVDKSLILQGIGAVQNTQELQTLLDVTFNRNAIEGHVFTFTELERESILNSTINYNENIQVIIEFLEKNVNLILET